MTSLGSRSPSWPPPSASIQKGGRGGAGPAGHRKFNKLVQVPRCLDTLHIGSSSKQFRTCNELRPSTARSTDVARSRCLTSQRRPGWLRHVDGLTSSSLLTLDLKHV